MLSPAITLFLLFFSYRCLGQTAKEQSFTLTVRQVIAAFSKQDSTAIARFIHKGTGLYQLDRVGAFNHYNHFKSLRFSDSTYPQVLFRQAKGISILPLQYASLPVWSCEKEVWSKKGLFVFFQGFAGTETNTRRTGFLLKQLNLSMPRKTTAGESFYTITRALNWFFT